MVLIYKKHREFSKAENEAAKKPVNDDRLYSEILETPFGKVKYYETRPASVMYIPSDVAVPGITVSENEYVKLQQYKKRQNMLGVNHNWLIPTNIYGEVYNWPGYE